MWEFIRRLANLSPLPWCIWEDFNDLPYVSNKKGNIPHPQNLLDGFRSVIEDCHLLEVELSGGEYTWEKIRGTNYLVRQRLNRLFACNSQTF